MQPVKWSASFDPADTRAGEVGMVVLKAEIQDGWHIYSLKDVAEATPTSFTLPAGILEKAGDPQSDKPIVKYDNNFMANTAIHEGTAMFRVPVRIKAGTAGAQAAKVSVTYQGCDKSRCLRPETEELPLSLTVAPGEPRPDRTKSAPAATTTQPTSGDGQTDAFAARVQKTKDQGLLPYLWFAFSFGLLALVTPCVFPMIPITVSYFTKGKKDGGKADVKGALAYCLGIMGTFTALGLVMTALFGATGINKLAANPWVNLGLAILFLVLAANLMGIFEIRPPSWLVNKTSEKSRTSSGLVGPILMGLTFSLTSFTCTVPFVGSILATASRGEYVYPTLGMLAFSAAFALPFFLLAIFPSLLARLPKSGSWLNTVKVFMGFLEIAAALKFISNVDLVWQAGVITRSVFLALWTCIAVLGCLYLLGAIRLPHEDPGIKVGLLRRLFALGSLAAAGVCLAALQGKPLGQFSAFLPPDPYPGSKNVKGELYQWSDNYEAALETAKQSGKNLFIDFTGVTCTNCRYMEINVFPLPSVNERFKKFVLVRLYTDRGTKEDLHNQTLEDQLAKTNSLPAYVIVSPQGKVLKVHQQQIGMNDEAQFLAALDSVLKRETLQALR